VSSGRYCGWASPAAGCRARPSGEPWPTWDRWRRARPSRRLGRPLDRIRPLRRRAPADPQPVLTDRRDDRLHARQRVGDRFPDRSHPVPMTGTRPAPETAVPDDEEPAGRCPYCDRPFAEGRLIWLHVGEHHSGVELTDEHRRAVEVAREAESDELFFYSSTALALMAILLAVVSQTAPLRTRKFPDVRSSKDSRVTFTPAAIDIYTKRFQSMRRAPDTGSGRGGTNAIEYGESRHVSRLRSVDPRPSAPDRVRAQRPDSGLRVVSGLCRGRPSTVTVMARERP
jgi:hypothetical protein